MNCKICAKKTNDFFNIRFVEIYLCEYCASAITMQQVKDWSMKAKEVK